MSTDIVPFGKYKGRPVVDLIADRSYTDWLAAQPWFRERYATVYNLIVTGGREPQDSPEHNKMQARYLDHDACLGLTRVWLWEPDKLRAEWDECAAALTERQRANLEVGPFTAQISGLQFEAHGWDLFFRAEAYLPVSEVSTSVACECRCDPDRCGQCTVSKSRFEKPDPDRPHGERHYWEETLPVTPNPAEWSKCYGYGSDRTKHCVEGCPATWRSPEGAYSYSRTAYDKAADAVSQSATVAVELKPLIGDDYPSVLRAVVKRRDLMVARTQCRAAVLVLADDVQTEGVELDAIRRIFRSQRVTLRTTAELPEPTPEWRCQCGSCAVQLF